MGCSPSLPFSEQPQNIQDEEEEDLCTNLNVSEEQKCKAIEYNKQMDMAKLPYLNTLGPLIAMKKTNTWSIYFHFTDWSQPINAVIIQNLYNQFNKSLQSWLCHLKGYNDFPITAIKVKIFGFVFNENIKIDPSFYNTYGKYPIVTNWKEDNEKCPWLTEYNGRLTTLNYYRNDLDFTNIRIVGNKTVPGVSFTPKDWKTYEHPEKISYFQTKFWNGTQDNFSAQRHYLRIGGAVSNYATGNLGTDYLILVHEMGHCFFLDDLYDNKKYNWKTPCKADLNPMDSIMFRAPKLQVLDHLMLRHTWDKQKKLL